MGGLLRGFLWGRPKARQFVVTIEYAGELEGPQARLATNPEMFLVFARSPGEARAQAVKEWSEKYQAHARQISRITSKARL